MRAIEMGCDHIAIAITRNPQGKPGKEWVISAVELNASGSRGYLIHINTLEDNHAKVGIYTDNVAAMHWSGIIEGTPCGAHYDCGVCRDEGYSDGTIQGVLFDPDEVNPLE